jgi:hypothetical protein
MTNQSIIDPLAPALTAIIDFATALRDSSDSSIDDAQLHADAIFDLLDDDDRAFFNDSDNFDAFTDLDSLPSPLIATLTDPADIDAYNQLHIAYIALLNTRP